MAEILGKDIIINHGSESTGPIKRVGNVLLGVAGVTFAGVFALFFLTLKLGMMIGGIIFLWWLSDWGYSIGWPLGFPLRVIAVIATLGIVFPIIMVAFMLGSGIFVLVTAPFRR